MERRQRIKRLLNETGIPLSVLAEKAGVSYTALRQMFAREEDYSDEHFNEVVEKLRAALIRMQERELPRAIADLGKELK